MTGLYALPATSASSQTTCVIGTSRASASRPTLRSAYGIRPDQISDGPLEPVPAELVAHWRFDEPDGSTVHDGSGSGHHGHVVGEQRIEGRSGRALKSILRFGDIKDSENRQITEYVIIGTSLSFGWAMLVSTLVQIVWNAL